MGRGAKAKWSQQKHARLAKRNRAEDQRRDAKPAAHGWLSGAEELRVSAAI